MSEFEDFVTITPKTITLPTYEIGKADSFPHFLEKRIYQGASGAVYPYRVVEHIQDDLIEKEYTAIYLENAYIKIMVLPELGGRIQMAWDKIGERHFVYYNQVIKPALVGLTGPWISGGIEFNWPQHHRPSTYLPVNWNIIENDDGSKTLWVGETERMYGLTGMAGFTLHPDRAYLEIRGRVFNGTSSPQTFLWWANPAVKAGDGHQSVFPPDVTAVFDHGKRDVSSFPIATGEYYKMDYSKGVDISRYKNIPVPTSYMAWKSQYNFVGAYDHEEEGGLLHIADYQISPGKKQWTWGNGEFGKAWDRNLTDEDGPYIELMTGVFTDNQPDFAWIDPYEEKNFTQIFMPYRKLGTISNANKDVILKCTNQEGQFLIDIFATHRLKDWSVQVSDKQKILMEESFSASPKNIWHKGINLPTDIVFDDIEVVIKNECGQTSLIWQKEKPKDVELPKVAKAPPPPKDVKYNEELWLIGMHIMQYHHGTANPMDYWQEALKRDNLDYRNNLAIARFYINQGLFDKALIYLKAAHKRITMLNTNPYDGEVFFYLGLCEEKLGRLDNAFDYYYKAIWNGAWADKAYFALSYLEVKKGRYGKASEFIKESLARNSLNEKSQHLNILILRLLGKKDEAIAKAKENITAYPFAFGALYELYLLTNDEKFLLELNQKLRNESHNYIDLSIDYMQFGDIKNAAKIIDACKDNQDSMLHYYHSYYAAKLEDTQQIGALIKQGDAIETPNHFPNRTNDITILEYAMAADSKNAAILLGDFYYAKKAYDNAIALWEITLKQQPHNIVALRNLAIAYYNKKNKPKQALDYMEKALKYAPDNSRLFLELDQLYQMLKKSPQFRLKVFEAHKNILASRDDLYAEYIKLLNLNHQYESALEKLNNHKFHPWEGGEGSVSTQWVIAHIMLAKKAMFEGYENKAIDLLEQARLYPENLGEGKLIGTTDNEILYMLGVAYEKLGERDKAKNCFEQATQGNIGLSISHYYNDQPADYILFQGLAKAKLGDTKSAQTYFDRLRLFAENNKDKKAQYDFFAVSLPNLFVFDKDIQSHQDGYCNMLLGYSYLGEGNKEKSTHYLNKALEESPDNSRIFLVLELEL